MSTTATIPTIDQKAADLALPAVPVGVPALDRLAMRLGLALLLWGRHRAVAHAAARHRTACIERETLIRDPRWYLR